jgi:hypothetical protein
MANDNSTGGSNSVFIGMQKATRRAASTAPGKT